MKAKFDHDLHIHSILSLCARHPDQTKENILQYAIDNGLNTICITDHFWDEDVPCAENDWYQAQNYPYISQIKPLPQAEGIRFLFGCETEMDKHCNIGISKEKYDFFDFIIIPTTHFHMRGFTIAEEDLVDAESIAKAWIKRLDKVFAMNLPFRKVGLAHLTTALAAERPELYKVIEAIPGNEMYRVFKKATELGVGIELNVHDMNFTDEDADILLKPYRIAKECGCKFYFGSDAHTPEELQIPRQYFERAIEFLELEDTDMFKI